MSYLAIARKYRPASFDEIVGQEHVTRTLRNAITGDRIHHAYLFCGARGVGKTTAARALAKSLNCEQGPTATPCGVCGSCTEIARGASPDLIEIDGASNNSVDDVRELRETVHYAPTRGRYKVYLVDEVHMLSKAAFNALLKTLEEPPPHVVFIFATTEPHRILDTILSRVQRFDFKRIGVSATAEHLRSIADREGITLSDTALRWVARAGDGSMRDAQSLLDKVISFGSAGELTDDAVADILGLIDRSLLFSFIEGLLKGQPGQALDAVAQVYDYGHELSQFTADLLELLRDATLVGLSEGAREHLEASDDEVSRLQGLVEGVDVEQLTRIFNALLDVHDQVSRAMRPRIVLDMAVARLATVRPVQPVGALVNRLEQLERALSGRRPAPRTENRPRATREPTPPEGPPKGRRSPRSSSRGGRPDPSPPPEPDPEVDPARAWPEFAKELSGMGPYAARLAEGEAEMREGRLVVKLPAGRALAEARRAVEQPHLQELFRRRFPNLNAIELEILVGTGTDAERQRALQQAALADPEVRRIVVALGAEVELVTSLRDDVT